MREAGRLTGIGVGRLLCSLALALLPLPVWASMPPPDETCAGEACATSGLVYFGTRASGPGKGIVAARLDGATGGLTGLGLAAEVTNPTWLMPSPHRPILYSVSEVGNDGRSEASVLSFAADTRTGTLTRISQVGSGGGGATHLSLDARVPPPPAILVSNYGTGQITVVPLGREGMLAPVVSSRTDVGFGPSPRQRSAHPHGTAIDLTGRFVFVSDLGADRVFVYRLDPASKALTPAEPASVALPPGTGPRHIVMHPNGRFLYTNGEFTGDVALLVWDAAREKLALAKSIPTRGAGYTGELSSAELALAPDGRFLYVSNRGEDVLAVYAVDPATGDLAEVQRVPSGGRSPASFAIDPSGRWLLVANTDSDLVTAFARDEVTGKLRATGETLRVEKPASVAFLTR